MPLVPGGGAAITINTSQGSLCTNDCPLLHETTQETCNQSNMTHQCDGTPQSMSSSEDTARIQPFHHGDAGEQIQQEVEVSTV